MTSTGQQIADAAMRRMQRRRGRRAAQAGASPLTWDAELQEWVIDVPEISGPPRVLVKIFTARDYTDILRQQREHYGTERGWQKGTGAHIITAKNFPKTTNADVLELFRYWDNEFAHRKMKKLKHKYVDKLDSAAWKDMLRMDDRWRAVQNWFYSHWATVVSELTATTEFSRNEWFWESLRSLAQTLTVRQSVPSSYKLWQEAWDESVQDFTRVAKRWWGKIPWRKMGFFAGIALLAYGGLRIAEIRAMGGRNG